MASGISNQTTFRVTYFTDYQASVTLPPGEELLVQNVVEVHALIRKLRTHRDHQVATSMPDMTRASERLRYQTGVTWYIESPVYRSGNSIEDNVRHQVNFRRALGFAEMWEATHQVRIQVPGGFREANLSSYEQEILSNYNDFSEALHEDLYGAGRHNKATLEVRVEESRFEAIQRLLISVPVDETQTVPEQCSICRESYDATEEDGANHRACMLPGCKHVFGRSCISVWLEKEEKITCPLCRCQVNIK